MFKSKDKAYSPKFECPVEVQKVYIDLNKRPLYVCFLDGSNDRYMFQHDEIVPLKDDPND